MNECMPAITKKKHILIYRENVIRIFLKLLRKILPVLEYSKTEEVCAYVCFFLGSDLCLPYYELCYYRLFSFTYFGHLN